MIWQDGRFVERASISLDDRGYLLGDTVFATLRAIDGRPFALERHLKRLRDACEFWGIRAWDFDLANVVTSTVEAFRDATVRITISRGRGWGLAIDPATAPSISVAARATKAIAEEHRVHGIETMIVGVPRVPMACIGPHKIGACMNAVLARRELAGMLEGIQPAVDGSLASGVASNLFLVQGGTLLTPARECRHGVTREVLLELAPGAGLDVEERDLTEDDLRRADEVFFASTTLEALPVRAVAGVATYGVHAACDALRQSLVRAMRP